MSNDAAFMSHIITRICDYAVENGLDPNKTLKIVAKNILVLCNISDLTIKYQILVDEDEDENNG